MWSGSWHGDWCGRRLTRPLLVRYGEFLGDLFTGSLGMSYAGRPVLEALTGRAMWVTLLPPTEDATELQLLATERSCASGKSAEGRIRVVSQRYTDDELQIAIGVEPRYGDQECPGNPETPFMVHSKSRSETAPSPMRRPTRQPDSNPDGQGTAQRTGCPMPAASTAT